MQEDLLTGKGHGLARGLQDQLWILMAWGGTWLFTCANSASSPLSLNQRSASLAVQSVKDSPDSGFVDSIPG